MLLKIIETIMVVLCILTIVFTCAPTESSATALVTSYQETLAYSADNGLNYAYSLMGSDLLSESGDPLMIDIETTLAGASVNYFWVRSDKKTPVTIAETTLNSAFPKRSSGAWHNGTDLGTPVSYQEPCWQVALWPGIVVIAEKNSSYGHTVVIDHGNGFFSRYAHMGFGNASSAGGKPRAWESSVKRELGGGTSSLQVKVGDYVTAGQILGTFGTTGSSSGPHAHIELMISTTGHYSYSCWRADVYDLLSNNKKLADLKWYYGTKKAGYSTKGTDGLVTNIPGISENIFRDLE